MLLFKPPFMAWSHYSTWASDQVAVTPETLCSSAESPQDTNGVSSES